MAIMRLIRQLYSRRMLQEIFLAIQVFLMVILLSTSIVPLTNVLILSSDIDDAFTTSTENLIYFCPKSTQLGVFAGDELLNEILNENSDLSLVGRTNMGTVSFEDKTTAKLLVYSEELYNNTNIKLEQGNFMISKDENIIDVVITPNLAEAYTIGDIIPISIVNSSATNNAFVRITGIIAKDALVMNIAEVGGSIDGLSAISSYISLQNQNYMICVSDQGLIYDGFGSAALLSTTDSVEAKETFLNHEYSLMGTFSSFHLLYENTLTETLKSSELHILLMILFLIVLVCNFFSYIVLSIDRKRKLSAIFFMCGMSFAKAMLLNIVANLFITIPPIIIALYFAPMFIQYIFGATFYGFHLYVYLMIIGIFVITIICGIFMSFVGNRKKDIILQYKGAY